MTKYVNEAHRIAAWLKANAKHMKYQYEIDQMLRAAMIMNFLANEIDRTDEKRTVKQ